MNIAQHILAFDVRYSNYRTNTDPQHRTLYIRRRSQLLRDLAKKDHDTSIRRNYLQIRKQLLAKKYGSIPVTESLKSFSVKSHSSIETKIELNNLEIPRDVIRLSHKYRSESYKHKGSIGSLKMIFMSETIPDELIDIENEGVVPTNKASASRAMGGNTTLSENYAFSGMFHIFDQHADAVNGVKFANNDKFLFACCSKDSTLSVCSLEVHPPRVKSILHGHKGAVNDFDWSSTNDLLVSASDDCTAQIWNASSGQNIRTIKDHFETPVNCCRFMPLNNNLVVTGNEKGHVQVFNTSTGMYAKDGVVKGHTAIKCMAFDPTGTLLWTGDEKGAIVSFMFNIVEGKLVRGKRFVIPQCGFITSICARTWVSREARAPSLLVNCLTNRCMLLSICDSTGEIQQKACFPIKLEKEKIRSSFCPLMSFRQGACIVTGSEDTSVYFFNIDEPLKPINTLLGHSAPVLDVCWNYDESLLASCDAEGTVIIWKRVH
ncbi:WD repeat-containing protein 13 isoform X2 [Hydra vulgaris]|uniref:WD repeat-containing protein 13 isoform X2 n=1 Tax=Hydra vulgaris TaxID=6087 RepID=A0ABM4CDZ3_HYDVU